MKLFMLELELREAAGEKFIMHHITPERISRSLLRPHSIYYLWMLSRSEMCSGYSSRHKEPPFNFENLKNAYSVKCYQGPFLEYENVQNYCTTFLKILYSILHKLKSKNSRRLISG